MEQVEQSKGKKETAEGQPQGGWVQAAPGAENSLRCLGQMHSRSQKGCCCLGCAIHHRFATRQLDVQFCLCFARNWHSISSVVEITLFIQAFYVERSFRLCCFLMQKATGVELFNLSQLRLKVGDVQRWNGV